MRKLPADQETNPDDNTEQAVTPKRNITVSVVNGETSVGNATVTIGSISGTTGPRGAACTLENVPDGEQNITVTAEGFDTKTQTITVSSSNTTFTIEVTAVANQGGG